MTCARSVRSTHIKYLFFHPHFSLKHCLPNCEDTTYSTTVSAAPFRRCDQKTLGLSPLCDPVRFDETDGGFRGMNPPIWGQSAIKRYR